MLLACHTHTWSCVYLLSSVPPMAVMGTVVLAAGLLGCMQRTRTHPSLSVQTMAAWRGSRQPATFAAAPVLQHTLVHCTYFSLCVPPFDSTTCCTSVW